jgi:carboxypeptidase C (cathepsin A)
MRTWTILSLAVAIPVQAAIRGGLDGGRFWDYSPAQHAAIAAHQAEQELLTRDQHNERNDSHEKGQDEPKASKNSTSSYKYLSNQTEEFFVKSLPDVNFDFGELYSGLIPIDPSNKSEGLFFVFGVKPDEPVDEVTIWLNGGPGCSSLTGFLQENGPISWQPGTHLPAPNAYSWTTLTNVLW